MSSGISDYAFLSDCRTGALVGRDGSIDWYCPGRFDAPSAFARLLGPTAGHWSLSPIGDHQVERAYIADTLVLRSRYSAVGGTCSVTDALLLGPSRGHEIGPDAPGVLVREVEGLAGEVALAMALVPRLEYGITTPVVRWEDGAFWLGGGPLELRLHGPVEEGWADTAGGTVAGRVVVGAGQRLTFALAARQTFAPAREHAPAAFDEALADTIISWRSWSGAHAGIGGPDRERVAFSARVLQGLTYAPSGAIVAAATTSLPEEIGGSSNWDYRYGWLRDSSLMLRAQWIAACPDEATRYFRWMAHAGGVAGDAAPQIVFGLEGERDLHERELPHLEGYQGSRPVRVGNDAWRQRQLDVLGEVLDAAHTLREHLIEPERSIRDYLVAMANGAARMWRDPDAGMWEARDEERRYLSSALMCWVALDRALELGDVIGSLDDRPRWEEARDQIRAAILDDGWDASVGAFVGAFGSESLDASVLLIPIVGFLPAGDERVLSTIAALERALGDGRGLLRRWDGDPNPFLLCSYWLVECLAMAGDVERARLIFDHVGAYATDLGLLSEEVDAETGRLLGNFPQAFSHTGLINAAWRLQQLSDGADRAIGDTHRDG